MAATAASHKVENWDDDDDLDFNGFQGSFNASTGTQQTSISSRLSVHSESVAGGDDDWNLVVNDEQSTAQAIQSAKQAGIPLPSNVPQSALLGGTIKRLGKKKSRQKLNDDWDNDIEMPDLGAPLKLRAMQPPPIASTEEYDDFDELEGSLGIRFGGTKRDTRNRSSSASAMSPSLGSVTAESEVDDLGGLELPEGPMDFEAILKKRRAADAELSDLSQASPAIEQPSSINVHKKSKLLADDHNEDYLNDFDLGGGGDLLSRRQNKNIKVKNQKPTTNAPRPATTINFHDKATDRPLHTRSHIPRPVSGSRQSGSRLEPVFESGASRVPSERRQPTTTGAQLLRSKRSMPVLGNRSSQGHSQQPSIPSLLPANQPQHGVAQRPMPYHLRRDSDPHSRRGAQSPPLRPHSRLSNALTPDTPSRGSRQRPDLAPSALAREAASKRTVTKPARRRNYGDGNELEIFDDLPTSTTKESKWVKQPSARGPPKPTGLRQTQSRSDMRKMEPMKRNIAIPDRMSMITPAPPRTPASPTKGFQQPQTSHTPSFMRDTAASRMARDTKLGGNPRPRSEGPLMPLSTNWKAQVAARSPHTSPSAQRRKPDAQVKKPQLIKGIGSHVAKTEKGMIYNPRTLCWEGNENSIASFDLPPPLQTPTPASREGSSYMDRQHHQHRHPSSSPPRPALIAPMSTATQGVQVNGGMVFDPRQMKWLKLREGGGGRDAFGPLSPSITDGGEEEDPFAGIEPLKDELSPMPGAGGGGGGMASPVSMGMGGSVGGLAEVVHEEFDLGPRFIQIQMEQEVVWRRRTERWFPQGERRSEGEGWKWGVRRLAATDVPGMR